MSDLRPERLAVFALNGFMKPFYCSIFGKYYLSSYREWASAFLFIVKFFGSADLSR